MCLKMNIKIKKKAMFSMLSIISIVHGMDPDKEMKIARKLSLSYNFPTEKPKNNTDSDLQKALQNSLRDLSTCKCSSNSDAKNPASDEEDAKDLNEAIKMSLEVNSSSSSHEEEDDNLQNILQKSLIEAKVKHVFDNGTIHHANSPNNKNSIALTFINVPADGDCAFHAINVGLNQLTRHNTPNITRNDFVNLLKSMSRLSKSTTLENKAAKKILKVHRKKYEESQDTQKKLSQTSEWLTDEDIGFIQQFILSDKYIFIWQHIPTEKNEEKLCIIKAFGPDENNMPHLHLHTSMEEYQRTQNACNKFKNKTIHIYYNGTNHYSSLLYL